jgi:cellulose synthase/poly-beta-1,6-N-acetylglucosamine synthase-like glycosyltransferase
MSVAVGIAAYNEANNIGRLLKTLSKETLGDGFSLDDICVVASGCTDGTEEVVKRCMKLDPRIRLLVEKERKGKASAINILLAKCKSDVLIMEPADTIPQNNSLRSLVLPFKRKSIGATSGTEIPVNSEHSVMGLIPHVQWKLFDYVSQSEDKDGTYYRLCGEFCAIRTGIVNRIPETIVNDDAYIGLQIKRAGYDIAFVPEAKVIGKGPANVGEYVTQRRRVIYGHMQLEKENNAHVATINPSQILKALPRMIGLRPKKLLGTIAAVALEAFSTLLARMDMRQGKSHRKWRMVPSTKSLISK